MKLDNELFDSIMKQAEASPRRRMHYDLRTNPATERSQRILNVLMPDTVIPIHRHSSTSETIVICRGAIRVELYDEEGNRTDSVELRAGSDCPAIQVGRGVYHTSVCLEAGSCIFEAKDGPYDPDLTEEFAPFSRPEQA